MKLNSVGLPQRRSMHEWDRFVAVRPNGRRSMVSFRSPLRAAEWAMNAFHTDTWSELHEKGWTVQPVSEFEREQ